MKLLDTLSFGMWTTSWQHKFRSSLVGVWFYLRELQIISRMGSNLTVCV